MSLGPTLPPGAPKTVMPVLTAVRRMAEHRLGKGHELLPQIMVADDPTAPPMVIAEFGDTPEMRGDQLFQAVAVWPQRPARRVLWMCDVFMRVLDRDEVPEGSKEWPGPAPSQDPKSLEAVMMIYADRPEGVDMPRMALGSFPYGFSDRGAFHWLPGGEWIPDQPPNANRQVMAIWGACFSDEELLTRVGAGLGEEE
jgi:hypothetical protein